jgi:hypothetical protein
MELSRIYGFYCEDIALLFVDDDDDDDDDDDSDVAAVVSECVEFVCPVDSRRGEVKLGYGRGDKVDFDFELPPYDSTFAGI